MKRKLKCKTVVVGDMIGKLKAQSLSDMIVRRYTEGPELQKGFDEWYREKYGVPYGTERR